MKKIAVLIENKFEESELLYPYHRFREDFEVTLVGTDADTEYEGKAGSFKLKSDKASSEVSADDFDAIYVPGGFAPDAMRKSEATIKLVKDMHEAGKMIGAVCHGPWMLVEADILRDVKATSVKTIKTDLVNAGAKWEDSELVIDKNIYTARTPKDLPVQIKTMVADLCK